MAYSPTHLEASASPSSNPTPTSAPPMTHGRRQRPVQMAANSVTAAVMNKVT